MKVHDGVVGALLVLVGAVIFFTAQTFPKLAGLPYGPGLFPSIAAVGLAGCGLIIGLASLRHRGPWLVLDPLLREPRGLMRLAAVPLVVLGFALGLDPLGFHLTALLSLIALLLVFGVGPVRAVLYALPVTVVTHAVFYSLLGVPLPWGLLRPFAW